METGSNQPFSPQNAYLIRGDCSAHQREVLGTRLRLAGRSLGRIRCALRRKHGQNGVQQMTASQILHLRKGAIWRRRSIHYWSRGVRRASQADQGVRNYEWTPETDTLLADLCAKRGAATAKRIMGRKIQEGRLTKSAPRPDSVRKAVEYRMAKLEIPTEHKRRSRHERGKTLDGGSNYRVAGCSRADATIESIAARTAIA